MIGVLTGFAVIGTVIAIGYLVGRLKVLGDDPRYVLSRIVFFVLTPSLLFTVLAEADVHVLFSTVLVASIAAAVVPIALYLLVALLVWRRRAPEATIGAMASGYVNANNIGLPIALYVLGDATLPAPVLLFQLVVLTPIVLTVLDASTSGSVSWKRIVLRPVTNPLIIASALGLAVSAFAIPLPDVVLAPFELIGGAAVPVVLLSFGMSLSGARPLQPGTGRRDVLLAVALKTVVMPVTAYLVARFALQLDAQTLFQVVLLASLPSAQNVFNYAQRYDRGETIARDAVLLSTIVSIPLLLAVAALLAPA